MEINQANLVFTTPEYFRIEYQQAKQFWDLIQVSERGLIEKAQHCLELGADPQHVDLEGKSAIDYAEQSGYNELAELLCSTPTERSDSASIDAVLYGMQTVNVAEFETQRLQAIAKTDKAFVYEEAKRLIDLGVVDINECRHSDLSPLYLTIVNGHEQLALYLIEKGAKVAVQYQCQPLENAALVGMHSVVEKLLEMNVNPNKGGSRLKDYPYAILCASQNGHTKIVDLLIQYGSKTDEFHDELGETPLLVAVMNGHTEMVDKLIKIGARVNLPANASNPHKQEPLEAACAGGYNDIVRLLVEAGADLNPEERDEATLPLTAAAQAGHIDCVSYLVDHGAKINEDALVAASTHGHDEIVRYFLTQDEEISIANAIFKAVLHNNETTLDTILGLKGNREYREEDASQALSTYIIKDELNINIFKTLLNLGAVPDHDYEGIYGPSLYYAVNRGSIEEVCALIDAGANPTLGGSTDDVIYNPLFVAICRQRVDILKKMLESPVIDIERARYWSQRVKPSEMSEPVRELLIEKKAI